MRVVAGIARGRRLVAPKGDTTRPTSDFVREAIFNALQSVIDMDGIAVVDLFAGSGGMGVEALSRGAATCTFVEKDRKAVEAIRANLAATGLVGGTVVHADASSWLARRRGATVDIAFADPPYEFDDWSALGVVDAGILVAESDRDVDLGPGWEILRSKRYGTTVVTVFTKQETRR